MRALNAAIAGILLVIATVAAAPALAEKRVALVIGNSAYENTPPLANPVNDATDMAAALKSVGFDVILQTNLKKRETEQAMVRFARMAQDADAALFYYAGHGIQFRGVNYLVPVDARLDDEFSLNFELTRVDDVTSVLDQARGVKVLVLDSCRNNPLAAKLSRVAANRGVTALRGLARIEAIRGMVIAYATQPNQVAVDGSGRNSPFTSALLQEIGKPGVEIGTLFRRVAMNVNQSTKGQQLPEVSLSLFGEFYLNGRDTDVQAWARIRDSKDTDKFKAFVRDYDGSPLVTDVRLRLAALDRERAERQERERLAREQAEREQRSQRQAERDRQERERLAKELAERDKGQQQQEQQLKDFAERERLAREELLRQIAERQQKERERLKQKLAEHDKARAEQEKILREQVEQARIERERLARLLADRETVEKERTARQDAEPVAPHPPEQPMPAQAASAPAPAPAQPVPAVAAPPPAPDQQKPLKTVSLTPPAQQAAAAPSTELKRDLQRELKRLGCYSGAVDGDWGARSKEALKDFIARAKQASLSIEPDEAALSAVKAQVGRVCPVQCGRNESKVGDRCVAKARRPAQAAERSPSAEPQGQTKGAVTGTLAYFARLREGCQGGVAASCKTLCDTGHPPACRKLARMNGFRFYLRRQRGLGR